MKKIASIVLLLMAAVSILSACGSSQSGGTMKKFVIAYLPGEANDESAKLNKDFEDKLSAAIGLPVESYKATSYNAAIEAMKNGKADMATFGPFSYIVAVDRAKVEPIVGISMPSLANSPASVIIVPKDSDIKTVADLKGKTMGFVDPVSTTGHLFPKSLIVDELGIDPEELESGFFKSIQFAGKHDTAVLGVVKGQYDAAGVSGMYPEMLVQKGLIPKDSYRVIAQSGPLNATPVGIRSTVPDEVKQKVKAFLLGYNNPEYFQNLFGMADAKFVEVKDSDFDNIRDVAKQLKLSSEDLLK
ncbi:phosphate/phosphite/phosphonate ABC transporter substrate-binding protein [Paenibacillus protaetiae]|uniref:Phosphate/phosphite/phosphonate ABC transporter substrate-binding protein n=1 Tax=Paenibacillus protaetiae TaxID=2509456 RepID=A0A4P6EWE1_9BACL|nr:phosphate/phosphite/phosphonate ABC transporter substrate-binding protein [Paenibacillus protaetiae]QAY66925.1 phosphate/phosphite/phosphonate ABC transporter substrate-binding protein [Paenibacillus protaetiae]